MVSVVLSLNQVGFDVNYRVLIIIPLNNERNGMNEWMNDALMSVCTSR